MILQTSLVKSIDEGAGSSALALTFSFSSHRFTHLFAIQLLAVNTFSGLIGGLLDQLLIFVNFGRNPLEQFVNSDVLLCTRLLKHLYVVFLLKLASLLHRDLLFSVEIALVSSKCNYQVRRGILFEVGDPFLRIV